MKQQEILKKIGIIIKELQDQYQFIENAGGPVNDLELELFVANGHFLSDHIEILRKLNEKQLKEQPEFGTHIIEKFFEPVVQPVPVAVPPVKQEPPAEDVDFELADEPVKTTPLYEEPVMRHELSFDNIDTHDEDEAQHDFDDMAVADDDAYTEKTVHFTPFTEPEPVINYTEPEPEINLTEPEPDFLYTKPEPEPEFLYREPEPEPEILYRKPEPEPEVVKPHPLPDTSASVADDIEKRLVTINQMISEQLSHTTRVADQLPPIKDLKSAINLNDKMLYVKDLFNGYSMSYGEAIDILNRLETFEEADHFLKTNYVTKNNWEAKQATTDKFYALLRRRFA